MIHQIQTHLSPDAFPRDHAVLADLERGIGIVADGFGGGRDSVAKMTVTEMMAFLKRGSGDQEVTLPFEYRTYCSLAGNVLCNSFVVANRKLRSIYGATPPQGKGGASAGAIFLDGDRLVLARVGAVSAWVEIDGIWTRLLAPDTWGEIDHPAAADPSPQVPLSALGLQKFVEPLVVEWRVRPGAKIALCVGDLSVSGTTQASRVVFEY